jgi:hypothetical protein
MPRITFSKRKIDSIEYGRARIIPMIFLPAKLTEYSNGSPVIVCLFLRLSKQIYVLNIQYIQHRLHIFLKLILQQFVPGITTGG